MIISTWNVNSIKVRIHAVLQYLEEFNPDVLVLQETKSTDDNFPVDAIIDAGYHVNFYGQKTYNGVAIISKSTPSYVEINPIKTDKNEARSLLVTIDEISILNLYVVNGQDINTDKYAYKLSWLKQLHKFTKKLLSQNDKVVLLGDFNIAPTNDDVFDIEKTSGQILCSDKERSALQRLLSLGLHDVFDDFNFPANTFTWWDYRSGAFQRNIGYRIDLILVSDKIRKKCSGYFIDKETRHKSWCLVEPRTSDHAPVRIILE